VNVVRQLGARRCVAWKWVGGEDEVSLWRAGLGVVGWMCGIGVEDGFPGGGGLRERLGVGGLALVLRHGWL